MNIGILLIAAAAGYLSGSVSYATILTRRVSGKEIREMGSRNPGSLNVGANLGKGWGILVGCLDGLKSFLPMVLAAVLLSGRDERLVAAAAMTAGIAAIIGHWRPVFHGFKGGQCVGTAIGVFLFIIPFEFLIAFAIGVALILLVVQRFVEKPARWAPLAFIILVPLTTLLFNALVDVPVFAHVSIGGHAWYWLIGIGTVCLLLLVINIAYIIERMGELRARVTTVRR